MTISTPRLSNVTLLSPEVRARELEDILTIGELFCGDRAHPLVNVMPLQAGRMLKHEILMHLVLDRAVRDTDLKPLQERVYETILSEDAKLLEDVETVRKSTEQRLTSELDGKEFDSVSDLEHFCTETLRLEEGEEQLEQVLQGMDREKCVQDLTAGHENAATIRKALAMRLADCAAQKEIMHRVNEIMDTQVINEIDGLPSRIPNVPLDQRRVFTVNGGAASGKSTTERKMLGEEGGAQIAGMPDRRHIITITRDSLMTSLLDPESLSEGDIDYFAAYAYDEAVLIANYVDRTRAAREKETGEGPHLFYDQVMPAINRYEVGLNSSRMDGVIVNMPVEISVLLAQLRGEKERRYAGRFCVLNSHKLQVNAHRQVVEYIKSEAAKGKPVGHIHSKIDTKVDKDLEPFPTVIFDFENNTLDVNSAGYFYDFLRKEDINLEAETLGDLYKNELTDQGYAELFMSFAAKFGAVKIKVLNENLEEEVVEYAQDDFPQLKEDLGTSEGKLSATVQRSRQAQHKSLSNAKRFIDLAKEADDKAGFLEKAEAQLESYTKQYGSEAAPEDKTGTAAQGIVSELRSEIEALRG